MSLSLRRRTPAPAPVAAPVKTLPFGGIHRLIRWEWHSYGAGYFDVGETVKVAETVTAADATHITSQLAARPGMHLPTLDIDLPAELRDSSTPGHHLWRGRLPASAGRGIAPETACDVGLCRSTV